MIVESCNSTWLFDTERMRYLRVLKGLDVGGRPAATDWCRYFGLEVDPDSESFVVMLNSQGTRLLRSWRHTGDCAQCGGHQSADLSGGELARAIRWVETRVESPHSVP
jgi:hypothetical protein